MNGQKRMSVDEMLVFVQTQRHVGQEFEDRNEEDFQMFWPNQIQSKSSEVRLSLPLSVSLWILNCSRYLKNI